MQFIKDAVNEYIRKTLQILHQTASSNLSIAFTSYQSNLGETVVLHETLTTGATWLDRLDVEGGPFDGGTIQLGILTLRSPIYVGG